MADYARVLNEKRERAFVAQRLGFTQPSVTDAVRREDYADDESYISALIAEKERRRSPQYQEARRAVEAELFAKAEREELAAQNERFKELKSKTTLDGFETEKVTRAAQEAAASDFRHGRISAAGLSSAIEKHKKSLTDKAIESKAANEMFNQMLRDAHRHSDNE